MWRTLSVTWCGCVDHHGGICVQCVLLCLLPTVSLCLEPLVLYMVHGVDPSPFDSEPEVTGV